MWFDLGDGSGVDVNFCIGLLCVSDWSLEWESWHECEVYRAEETDEALRL